METKPFSLQSPERIAKLYGGNKQKILQALQSGALQQFAPAPMDQLLAAAAANFIDEMRGAAQAEAAPQQTVFEQLFAPPAPQAPAGLGATPQAAAMPAPGAAPPMGMPSPQAAPMPAPGAAPPVGMAAGGMVPPYASGGGLSSLPLPDDMFDENRNGGFNDGYRGGGLVAFAGSGLVKDEDEDDEEEIDLNGPDISVPELIATGPAKAPPAAPALAMPAAPDFAVPENLYGLRNTLAGNMASYAEAAPRETKYAKEYAQYLEGLRNPEEMKKRSNQDKYLAAAKGFLKMAQTPGSIFQAAAAGAQEALPGIAAADKERRADERAIMQALVSEERTSNKEITERADKALDMVAKYGTLAEAMKDRAFRNLWESMASADRRYVAQVTAAAGIRQQEIGTAGQITVGGMDFVARKAGMFTDAYNNYLKNAALDPNYNRILEKAGPIAADRYLRNLANESVDRVFGSKTLRFDSRGNPIQ